MSAVMKPAGREFIQSQFCDRLRRARTGRGFTQLALSHAMSINDEQITRWERGHAMPRTDLLIRLALVLDIDVEWLLFGDPARGPRLI